METGGPGGLVGLAGRDAPDVTTGWGDAGAMPLANGNPAITGNGGGFVGRVSAANAAAEAAETCGCTCALEGAAPGGGGTSARFG